MKKLAYIICTIMIVSAMTVFTFQLISYDFTQDARIEVLENKTQINSGTIEYRTEDIMDLRDRLYDLEYNIYRIENCKENSLECYITFKDVNGYNILNY